jgi:hypothetical protein
VACQEAHATFLWCYLSFRGEASRCFWPSTMAMSNPELPSRVLIHRWKYDDSLSVHFTFASIDLATSAARTEPSLAQCASKEVFSPKMSMGEVQFRSFHHNAEFIELAEHMILAAHLAGVYHSGPEGRRGAHYVYAIWPWTADIRPRSTAALLNTSAGP